MLRGRNSGNTRCIRNILETNVFRLVAIGVIIKHIARATFYTAFFCLLACFLSVVCNVSHSGVSTSFDPFPRLLHPLRGRVVQRRHAVLIGFSAAARETTRKRGTSLNVALIVPHCCLLKPLKTRVWRVKSLLRIHHSHLVTVTNQAKLINVNRCQCFP